MRRGGPTWVGVLLVAALVATGLVVWLLPPPAPGSVEQVIYPAGTVLRYPGSPFARFSVPSSGGLLVGAALVDHSIGIGVFPVGGYTSCGVPLGYLGPAWNYTLDYRLSPGAYVFGPVCGGFANLTVTDAIEVVYP